MAFGNNGIFPTSVYGQITDSYGLPTYTNSANPFSNTGETGLQLGQGWLLFDFTVVNLFKVIASVIANGAVNGAAGFGNFYNVQQTQNAAGGANGSVPVTAINDRGGALITGGINWMTTTGLATAFCAASLTASSNPNGAPLGSSAVAGQLTSSSVGSSYYNNVLLLSNTSAAGNYPVQINGS